MSEITPEQAMAALDPPTRVYALAVRAAAHEYNRAIAEASRKRAAAIDEALKACLSAMEEVGP